MQVINKSKNGRVWSGVFLLGIGAVLLLKQLGVFFPYWLFTWPVFLIGLGLFLGLKHGFRGPAWFVLLAIGGVFLADIIDPDINLKKYALPAIFIGLGLLIIFRPKRFGEGLEWKKDWKHRRSEYEKSEDASIASETTSAGDFKNENFVDAVAIFGAVRKVIVSKDFKGGDLVAIFGGNEIDLSQADIQGPVVIEFVQIMGGSKLYVPAHWDVRSEMVAIFGGIEDKRKSSAAITAPKKVLILKGTSIFGGIDIKTY